MSASSERTAAGTTATAVETATGEGTAGTTATETRATGGRCRHGNRVAHVGETGAELRAEIAIIRTCLLYTSDAADEL